MSWLDKVRTGLKKSTQIIGDGLKKVLAGKTAGKLTDAQLEEIGDILLQGDVGVETTLELLESLRGPVFESQQAVLSHLENQIEEILQPFSNPFSLAPCVETATCPLQVVLMAGVNGSGKTTSIAKLTHLCYEQGAQKIEWVACDTFRAAAVEQLREWAAHLHVPVYDTYPGQGEKAHPASLAFYALEQAQKKGTEVLFVDTAGRLQNNDLLMNELAKIVRILKKWETAAVFQNILVLDGTTGQNVLSQVEHFQKIVPLTGLIVTKLDGTAKAGFLIHLCKKTKLSLVAVGVGEKVEDMNAFDPKTFAQALLGM
ncbi:signal recognition particle receptor FtsY [Alphaproteobacteria bacterium]|nr:signal recognition particle receptor FtsY [Alphaproteobacteria bacterium]GHS96167.1 signal recognition particle receptor FtsY [Alphaproteobacteria bacterium]